MKYFKKILPLGVLFLMWGQAEAQLKKAPAEVAAAMLVKVADFEKGLSDGRDISIYVIDAPEVAAELRKGVGKQIGKSSLRKVETGSDLPASKPSILFVGSASKVDAVLGYTHRNKVLSATGNPDLVEKGITLGFGVGDDGKPKIILNRAGSNEEALVWNPALLKIAKLVQ